jgi:CRP-like cAMP-binding protein
MFRRMGPSVSELRTIPLFNGFSDAELGAIAGLFTQVEPGDKPLFDVAEQATTLYLLTNGEVVLDRPGDDVFRLHPPALIGELGALTGLSRSTRANVTPGSTVWALPAKKLQAYLGEHQELGVRFLVNLLTTVADKVHRDQRRLADMRTNLITTQKELKRLRELVLEAPETPISAPVHDTLDKLITHNRRVNYRVEPPPALAATCRFDNATHALDREPRWRAACDGHVAIGRRAARRHRDSNLGSRAPRARQARHARARSHDRRVRSSARGLPHARTAARYPLLTKILSDHNSCATCAKNLVGH